jgi:SAM-dependent methyltransferase
VLSRYIEGWFEHIMNHGDLDHHPRVLDVGCGTGRYTALIQARTGRPIVGLDPAAGMLKGAKERAHEMGTELLLVRGRGERMPFRDDAFDAATLFLVVHHVEDLDALCGELARVLSPGGRVLFQTRSHDEIRGSYIGMFPGVLEIVLARFPPIEELEARMRAAGFEGVAHQLEENPGCTLSIEEIIKKVDGRFISTLSLMSDEEFEEGREVFIQRLRERFGDGLVPTASFTFVWGDVPR